MNPVPLLLLQLVAILGTARLLARLQQRLGQPPVIGEMLAGIALFRTVLGGGAAARVAGRGWAGTRLSR